MTEEPDDSSHRNLDINVPGEGSVGIGGDLKESQIFTGEIHIQKNVYASPDDALRSEARIFLSSSLQASLICVYDRSSPPKIVGMGAFVGDKHIVTCGSVIAQALGISGAETPKVDDEVHFDFPLLQSLHPLIAHIVHWDPMNDLVGLEVNEGLPDGAQPALIKANKDIWGDSYQTFGFPEGLDMGAWAFGRIIGPQSKGQAQIKGELETSGTTISLGFSGSPVWDSRLQAVVGMIRLVNTTPGSVVASMLTAETMQRSWPLLLQSIPPERPYRGLEVFQTEHAHFFFGRNTMISRLQSKLQEIHFLAVVGSSGSGKSSLVQAGLIPALRAENPQIVPITFRPGTLPPRNLASALVEQLEPKLSSIERLAKIELLVNLITSRNSALVDAFSSLQAERPEASFLLIVDQFEEIFTSGVPKPDQERFIQLLVLASQQVERLKVIITIRADFFGSALSEPGLGRIVDAGQVNILPMTQVEIREAITQPVKLVGGSFEEGLVDQIIAEVVDQPGNLPHLQFMLAQLWDMRGPDNRMTYTAYQSMGGVQGAIAKRAEEQFSILQEQGKGEIVRRILTRLVAPDEQGRDTRRRAGRNEIEASAPTSQDAAWQVVQALTNSRLVVTDRDSTTGEETVEIAHEALIRNWSRLRDWVNSRREFYIWRQSRLEPRLGEWIKSRRRLLDNQEIVEAKRWLTEQRGELSSSEIEFIYHSLLQSEDAELATWLPRFGSEEQLFALLAPYWEDPDAHKRLLGVRALASLPRSSQEENILQRLETFALEDPSLEAACSAAHGVCRRGQIERFVVMLNQDVLPRERQDRLVKLLASTRNLPVVGHQVLHNLTRSRARVQIEAANLVVQKYRNELALTFSITFLVGLLGGILVSAVVSLLDQIFFAITRNYPSDPLNMFTLSIGSADIMLVLITGIFVAIQVRLIDQRPLSIKHLRPAIYVVMTYTLLFIVISLIGSLSTFTVLSILLNLGSGLSELLATTAFATFLAFSVFLNPLILEPRELGGQSMRVALKSIGITLLISLLLRLLFFLVPSVSRGVSHEIPQLQSGSQDLSMYLYFLSVSLDGFLNYLSNASRVFVYLIGFYFGLSIAFRTKTIREQLSEVR